MPLLLPYSRRPALAALVALALCAASTAGAQRRDTRGDARTHLDTTVALAPGGTVELALHAGSIVVTAWNRPEVRLVAESDGGRPELEATSARVSLDLAGHAPREARFEVSAPAGARVVLTSHSAELSVRGITGSVTATTNSGDIDLRDVAGRVEAHAIGGTIRVTGAPAELRLATVSGDVEAQGAAGLVDVETTSGEIRLTEMRARTLSVETVSGDVSYEGETTPDGRYELRAHSGEVHLWLREGTSARLAVESFSGTFESEYPVTLQPGATRGRSNRFEVAVGNGTGASIDVETFSGDIHLGRAGARPRPATFQRSTP